MQRAPVCPCCQSPDVYVGDSVGACEACGYWGPAPHFTQEYGTGPIMAALPDLRADQAEKRERLDNEGKAA